MGDSAEVSAPILDAGQIEVTTVQVVQNVDADRILGTLKWLVDRVNKLSEGPLKDDIRDVRELIQGSSDLLAEQCKKQDTLEQQLLQIQGHVEALQRQKQESHPVSQEGQRELPVQQDGNPDQGNTGPQASESSTGAEPFLRSSQAGVLANVPAVDYGTQNVEPGAASQLDESGNRESPRSEPASSELPPANNGGPTQRASIAVTADGFPAVDEEGVGLVVPTETNHATCNDTTSSKEIGLLRSEVWDLRSQLERMQGLLEGQRPEAGEAMSRQSCGPELGETNTSSSSVYPERVSTKKDVQDASTDSDLGFAIAPIMEVQGDLDQLKQEVAELRLRLSPVADMRERHAMVCDPKVTSDIRSDETQTCASRRVSATVTGINPITVQTNNDERRPVEETRVSQRQVAENFGIADSIATLEQRLALLESRKSGEVPGGPESKEGSLRAEIVDLLQRMAAVEQCCHSSTRAPEGHTESELQGASVREESQSVAALLQCKADASAVQDLKEALNAMKMEMLQYVRRSSGDTPPLTRLRSFQRVRSSGDCGGVEAFGFTSLGLGPGSLDTQGLTDIQTRLQELEQTSEVVAAAVAVMAGPWSACATDNVQDNGLDKSQGSQGDGVSSHPGTASQSLGPGLLLHNKDVSMSKKWRRKAEGNTDRADQCLPASDAASLQKLLDSGALHRKMDYVESDVFAILMKRLAEMEAVVDAVKAQAALTNTTKPVLEKALRRVTGEVAALKRKMTSDLSAGSNGDHSIMARKPIMGYRCMACDQPLQGLCEGPGSPLPTPGLPVSITIDYARSNGIDPAQHQRPMTASQATSPNGTHGATISISGLQDWYGHAEKQTISRDEIGPRLLPGGWRSRPGTAAPATQSFPKQV